MSSVRFLNTVELLALCHGKVKDRRSGRCLTFTELARVQVHENVLGKLLSKVRAGESYIFADELTSTPSEAVERREKCIETCPTKCQIEHEAGEGKIYIELLARYTDIKQLLKRCDAELTKKQNSPSSGELLSVACTVEEIFGKFVTTDSMQKACEKSGGIGRLRKDFETSLKKTEKKQDDAIQGIGEVKMALKTIVFDIETERDIVKTKDGDLGLKLEETTAVLKDLRIQHNETILILSQITTERDAAAGRLEQYRIDYTSTVQTLAQITAERDVAVAKLALLTQEQQERAAIADSLVLIGEDVRIMRMATPVTTSKLDHSYDINGKGKGVGSIRKKLGKIVGGS